MKCILHIGTEKTGTTLLQHWLYANKQSLSRQKVYISDVLGKPNNRLFAGYFQHQFDGWSKSHNIRSSEDKRIFFDGFLEQLSAEVQNARAKHDVFIITCEHLHSRVTRTKDIKAVFDYLSGCFESIQVLCYFRHQADMAISYYSTKLKNDEAIDLESFLNNTTPERYYYNFLSIADKWSGIFGKDNCIFRIYDRDLFPNGDIRNDFSNQLPTAIDMDGFDFKQDNDNASLFRLEGAAIASINRCFEGRDDIERETSEINRGLKSAVSCINSLKRGKFETDKKEKIIELFEESNSQFLAKYFPSNTSLECKTSVTQNQDTFSFEEVEVITRDIFDSLLDFFVTESNQILLDSDAEYLRDIAMGIDAGSNLSLADSLALMQLAKRARPNGPVILEKITEYEARIDSKSTKVPRSAMKSRISRWLRLNR